MANPSETPGGDSDANLIPDIDRQIVVGPIQILPGQMLVAIHGRRLWLHAHEMGVLELLATNAGRTLSRAVIFETVWRRPFSPSDRSVDVNIHKLRAKLATLAPGWDYIHTHFRDGYRFEPEVRTGPEPGTNAR